mmetsp:Transcript_12825/g.23466  ORF Transcript_12825/g.23466 Transcript_12825/m.23466 type:complete len:229 (+) Transcript_12825:148-834(+)
MTALLVCTWVIFPSPPPPPSRDCSLPEVPLIPPADLAPIIPGIPTAPAGPGPLPPSMAFISMPARPPASLPMFLLVLPTVAAEALVLSVSRSLAVPRVMSPLLLIEDPRSVPSEMSEGRFCRALMLEGISSTSLLRFLAGGGSSSITLGASLPVDVIEEAIDERIPPPPAILASILAVLSFILAMRSAIEDEAELWLGRADDVDLFSRPSSFFSCKALILSWMLPLTG